MEHSAFWPPGAGTVPVRTLSAGFDAGAVASLTGATVALAEGLGVEAEGVADGTEAAGAEIEAGVGVSGAADS